MIWSREFVGGTNDRCCGLQEAIVVTVYLLGYLCWPHANSPTSSWAGGASSPQYTAPYQPDAASTHSPPPLLFSPSPSPHLLSCLCGGANKQSPPSLLSFKPASLFLSVHLLLPLKWSDQVRLPSSVTVKGPGNEGMVTRGDRSFVGVNTHDPWGGRRRKGVGESLSSNPDPSHPIG